MKQIINGEEIEVLLENDKMRVERITSFGNASPEGFWYDQEEDEWVMLTKGNATIDFCDKQVQLCTNAHMLIPAHKKHRVSYTSQDAVWLCVFLKNIPQ